MVPESMASSAAVAAVTVRATDQVAGVKCRVVVRGSASASTVTSGFGLVTVTVTGAVGCVARATVYGLAASVAWPSVRVSGPGSASPVAGSASRTRAGSSASGTITVTARTARAGT